MELMNIIQREVDGVRIVAVDGKLDTINCPSLEKVLAGLVEEKVLIILLDCEKLVFISSSGLRVLLLTLKKINASEGRLALCNMRPGIQRIFGISGFSGIFEIFNDTEEALAALNQGGVSGMSG